MLVLVSGTLYGFFFLLHSSNQFLTSARNVTKFLWIIPSSSILNHWTSFSLSISSVQIKWSKDKINLSEFMQKNPKDFDFKFCNTIFHSLFVNSGTNFCIAFLLFVKFLLIGFLRKSPNFVCFGDLPQYLFFVFLLLFVFVWFRATYFTWLEFYTM